MKSLISAALVFETALAAGKASAVDDAVLDTEAAKKRILGQFFTEGRCWLLPQVLAFIESSGCRTIYDPFAGSGCLFNAVTNETGIVEKCVGLDIDPSLGWEVNDSLKHIPHIENAVIVTNPPYLSSYSATRKKIGPSLAEYFAQTTYDDLYLLALDRMLDAQDYVVAIIPETFINSSYRRKHRLCSITVLEENPFSDTDAPVVVACFDGTLKSLRDVDIYKSNCRVCSLQDVEDCRMIPTGSPKIRFNAPSGWLGVRCVDTTDPSDVLRFDFKENFSYDWDRGIKASSRLLTLVDIDVPEQKRQDFIDAANIELRRLRIDSHDLVFSPFKGNMRNGVRRRRLDFATARAILEKAYGTVVAPCKQLTLL